MKFDLHESASERFALVDQEKFKLARIASSHGNIFKILTEDGEGLAKLSGKLSHQMVMEQDLPVVGDWVVLSQANDYDEAIIHEVLPRKSKLSRAKAGTEFGEQLIAANVDECMIVMALNHDFNLRRLERYLIAVYESGANPVIVLSKTDLCDDLVGKILEVESVAFGVPIFTTSTNEPTSLQLFEEHFVPGKTYVLIGSSGVGKSTLTNCLLGEEVQATKEIREGDDRGKHTTTTRDLFYLENGICLIDTPGMREFGLFASEDGVTTGFSDISELAAQCRFNNCKHQSEPGCAIQAAIENGTLSQERFDSYLKLLREEAYALRKNDARLRAEDKKIWKQINKDLHARPHKKR